VPPTAFVNVVLTIDSVIQHIVETTLAEAMEKHSPISISGIVVRPRTGEILALATLPNYDPNNPGSATADARRNRVISDVAEPGSTFKIVVVSGALNDGTVRMSDVFDCEHNVLEALSTQPRPEEMVAGLGNRYYVTESAIKAYAVGYPIQAALDAFLTLRRENGLTVDNVDHIVVRLPADGAGIVDNSAMPDVNCQYVIAVALVDGAVSFANAHSYERMMDPKVRAVKERVQLVADKKLMDPDAPRGGQVEATLKNGKTVSHLTRHPPGTKENPLDTEGVNAKVRDLMAPVLGGERTEALIKRVNALEDLDDVRKLRSLLTM